MKPGHDPSFGEGLAAFVLFVLVALVFWVTLVMFGPANF